MGPKPRLGVLPLLRTADVFKSALDQKRRKLVGENVPFNSGTDEYLSDAIAIAVGAGLLVPSRREGDIQSGLLSVTGEPFPFPLYICNGI